MIYFARLASGAIKIGKTGNIGRRLVELEREFGAPIALLKTIPGGHSKEGELHRRFRRFRLSKSEQFRPTPELMGFIGVPVQATIDPESVAKTPKNRIIIFGLPEEIHRVFRQAAAEMDIGFTALARIAVEEYLNRQEGEL